MSFSGDTKQELCSASMEPQGSAQAECYGILLYANRFAHGEARIMTESSAFAARLPRLLQRAFSLSFDRLPDSKSGKQIFSLTEPKKLRILSEAFGYDMQATIAHHINFAVLEDECCRTAFFRGAFLAGGSVTDPAKGYHLELTTTHYSVDREMLTLLREAGFSPKSSTRGANYMTYFKQSEAITAFLTAIGAPKAAESLASARAAKHLRGGVNRLVNCDAANLDKTVDAAILQVEAIRRLQKCMDLRLLPPKLQEAACLRMQNPEMTLAQLAELCSPPITKSSLNHRLKRLIELASHTVPEKNG